MEIAGYIASVLIGISLGLIGGGGSILTVPVMVYLFGINAELATVYSLFIVGCTSVIGSISYFKKQLVDVSIGLFFGLPAIVAIFLTKLYLLPAIPNPILTTDFFILTKSSLLMLLFALLMLAASWSMIKRKVSTEHNTMDGLPQKIRTVAQGLFVGCTTGLIGAGGGFLIIPALVNLLRLPMKKAIGTSLFIISINALSGFAFSLTKFSIEWNFIITIAAIAIVGILIGSYLSTKISGTKLKPAFGWFILLMGLYIIIKETIFN